MPTVAEMAANALDKGQGGRAPSNAVITARNLDLTFQTNDGPVHALKDVSLEINKGDFVSFIGPSGCGKTTFLRCIAGLETPTAGQLSVNGMTPDEARRARAYGYVFQAAGLYPWRTIGGNIRLPLEIMGFDKAEQARRLMDEPFGALDEIVRDHLNEQLLQLWARTEKTIGFVTHSIPEAVYLSTKIVVMSPRPGRITDVIESPLPRERPLDIRDSPEFIAIAHRVRDGLRAGHQDDA